MASCLLRRALVRTITIGNRCTKPIGRRTILSDAHYCQEAWHARLQTPVLQKIDVGQLALRIQEKMEKGDVQKLDMDVLANKLEVLDLQQLDFIQQLFYRFRHTDETLKATASMSHAVVCALVHFNEIDRLLTILKNTTNFGIFLDDFSAMFLLDHLIKKEKYSDAVQVVYHVMFQEEFAHPVVRYLAWYVCDKHWRSPKVEEPQQLDTPATEEEDVWIPVDYIRHPWFDDHWDINRDSLLLGKSMSMISHFGEEEGILQASYKLLGYGLWEKFDLALDLLDKWARDDAKPTVSKEAVVGLMETLETVVTKEDPEEEVDVGSMTMDDVRPRISAAQKDGFLERAKECISQLDTQGQIEEVALEPLLADQVSKISSMLEAKDIEDQTILYQQWTDERQVEVEFQIEAARNLEKREEIAQKLVSFQQREEKLTYFENREKIMLGISRAPIFKPLVDIEEEEQFVAAPTERGRSAK